MFNKGNFVGTKKNNRAEYLQTAFADFERASVELQDSYASLEYRVSELTAALHNSQQAKSRLAAEKEQIAARLTSLLEVLPAGVVELNGDGTVAHYNPAASALLGKISVGEQWSAVVLRAFAPRWDDGHDISLTDGRYVNIDTAALSDRTGQLLLIKDVSETRRLQARLNHHQRISAKTEVAAALAHQIRTPLSTAMLRLSNLRHHIPEDTIANDEINAALKSIQHIERTVAGMLMFSKDRKFEMRVLTISNLLEMIPAKQNNVQILIDRLVPCLPEAPIKFRANCDALISVIQNLIDNAVHAGAEVITINISVEASVIKIMIADNGCGITEDRQARIFEPFYSTEQKGTGLGLPIARSVCRAHSGDLVLEKSTNGSTCFAILLPAIDSEFTEITDLKMAF